MEPTSFLLDKGVVRRIFEAELRLLTGSSPTKDQIACVSTFERIRADNHLAYVTEETWYIIVNRIHFPSSTLVYLRVLKKGKYLRRWARRLRSFGFSHEDSVILSAGAFGVDESNKTLGVEALVTTDLKMLNNYRKHLPDIRSRFQSMIRNLKPPYSDLDLPDVVVIDIADRY